MPFSRCEKETAASNLSLVLFRISKDTLERVRKKKCRHYLSFAPAMSGPTYSNTTRAACECTMQCKKEEEEEKGNEHTQRKGKGTGQLPKWAV